jgi:DNA-binding transcriptional MerR regulator
MAHLVMVKPVYLTRGHVAKQLKLHPETLRYYETTKLIGKPARLSNNYRAYNNEDVNKLKFIITAKELGFSLKETKELLNLSIDEKSNREKVRAIATQKSKIINEKIEQLSAIKKILDKLIKTCRTNKTEDGCPILEALHEKKLLAIFN